MLDGKKVFIGICARLVQFLILIFSWSIADLQYFVAFKYSAKWLSFMYIRYFPFYVIKNIEYSSLCYIVGTSVQFSSVQSLSRVRLIATPWIAACQASLSITNSRSSLKLMSIESVMPSSHLILCDPFLLLPPIPPSLRVFPMSQLFAWGSQSTGVSALASVLPMSTQDWFPLEWTGWISLQSKGLSRVFSNTTLQKHQFFSAQLSLYSNSHIHTWLLEKP